MQSTMNHTPRQFIPMASNKPKNREETFDFLKPFVPRATAPIKAPNRFRPPSDNKLLAGYLAHEFLTNRTLFGQPWDPARADAEPVLAAAHSADYRKPVKELISRKETRLSRNRVRKESLKPTPRYPVFLWVKMEHTYPALLTRPNWSGFYSSNDKFYLYSFKMLYGTIGND